MVKDIIIEDKTYTVTNEKQISVGEQLIFEMNDGGLVIAMWDDMLGSPIKNVWKILEIK
jgi:hypothetical protein